MKDDKIYIEHIQRGIARIKLYIEGKNYQSFSEDFLAQDAVIRQLEIIGEATKHISGELRDNNPHVPWSDMTGMRDILIHDYIDVDTDIVWKTASESLPELQKMLESLTCTK